MSRSVWLETAHGWLPGKIVADEDGLTTVAFHFTEEAKRVLLREQENHPNQGVRNG